MTSVIEQIAKPTINIYLCKKYGLSYDELLHHVSDNLAKKNKSNAVALQYYYDHKNEPEYQEKLMLSRSTYYNKNKIKLRAMTLARYENDLTFREEYQRYQAKYSQKKRGCNNPNENRGRPRKY